MDLPTVSATISKKKDVNSTCQKDTNAEALKERLHIIPKVSVDIGVEEELKAGIGKKAKFSKGFHQTLFSTSFPLPTACLPFNVQSGSHVTDEAASTAIATGILNGPVPSSSRHYAVPTPMSLDFGGSNTASRYGMATGSFKSGFGTAGTAQSEASAAAEAAVPAVTETTNIDMPMGNLSLGPADAAPIELEEEKPCASGKHMDEAMLPTRVARNLRPYLLPSTKPPLLRK